MVIWFSTVVLLWLLNGTRGQPLLTSSATSGFICKGDHLSFNCRGSAGGLTWIYNLEARSYPDAEDVQVFSDSSVYTVLLKSDVNMIVSELIFLNASGAVSVQCFVSGLPSSSSVTVLGRVEAPVITNYTITDRLVTVLLNHDQSQQIERFDIMLDGDLYSAIHNSQKQVLILLPECRTYSIQIVAVDICNNSNPSDVIAVCCTSSPITDPTTDRNTIEPVTKTTVAISLDERCVTAIHEVREVLIAILVLFLLVIGCGGAVLIVVISYKKFNSLKVKRKDSDNSLHSVPAVKSNQYYEDEIKFEDMNIASSTHCD